MGRGICALLLLAGTASIAGQSSGTVMLRVTETGGIRRTQFPVNARVPLPRGVLIDPSHTRLRLGQAEVAAQVAAQSRWPDGSLQWLDVDFNASLGPAESMDFVLQYGEDVRSTIVSRGLAVAEEADAIQVGNIRFNRNGTPLLASVKYRDEAIAPGENGLVVVDAEGVSHGLSTAESLKVEILKRGPLVVVIRYTGSLTIPPNASASFVLTAEMPSSKSWVKLSASVDDPARRVRDVAFSTPLALGPAPWVWDFGTTRWTYGSMRTAADSVVMNHLRSATSADWTVMNGLKGREQMYETSATDHAAFAGWGHVQGAKQVVAYAVEGLSARLGAYRITLDGEGQTMFRFTPASPQPRYELTVYEHFVSSPVQIGAATSPAAILSPLVAVCDRDQYVRSGVSVPAGAR
jgi:hypothetical protein